MTSLMGLEDNIVKRELLNYEASISESKYIILISSMPKMCIYAITLAACKKN